MSPRAEDQYALVWHDHKTIVARSVNEHMPEIARNYQAGTTNDDGTTDDGTTEPNFHDVTLVSSDKIKFHAHRIVLAAISPYFLHLFKNASQSSNSQTYIILDVHSSILKPLLKYMYCGQITVARKDLHNLFLGAKFLQVQGIATDILKSTENTEDDMIPQELTVPKRKTDNTETKAIFDIVQSPGFLPSTTNSNSFPEMRDNLQAQFSGNSYGFNLFKDSVIKNEKPSSYSELNNTDTPEMRVNKQIIPSRSTSPPAHGSHPPMIPLSVLSPNMNYNLDSAMNLHMSRTASPQTATSASTTSILSNPIQSQLKDTGTDSMSQHKYQQYMANTFFLNKNIKPQFPYISEDFNSVNFPHTSSPRLKNRIDANTTIKSPPVSPPSKRTRLDNPNPQNDIDKWIRLGQSQESLAQDNMIIQQLNRIQQSIKSRQSGVR